MNELILIRHGEAEHLVQDLTGGWSDTHLTERGRRQAQLTGECLARLIGRRPCQFYTSDLARTFETAQLIAEAIHVRPLPVTGLRELNNGAVANLSNAEAARIAIPMTEPVIDWAPYPGAESWGAMSRRVVAFLESLQFEHDLTLLVAHGGSGNAAISWWLGLGIGEKPIAFDLDPCSISRFAINRWNERVIIKLNDTAHLCLNHDSHDYKDSLIGRIG
jgi:probable phosphoglycerate mutase